ncbi:MAG: hypothetical protein CL916_04220 [Deltaproteobacteria bacterium]|nr:hypothetical protein [Deltaproteobacteria bacterium]
MSIIQKLEQLIANREHKKAQRLLEVYFTVYPQQAKNHITYFQENGLWNLPSVPQSLTEIENQVRLLWQENSILKAIEFYRLHTNLSLKESAQRVRDICTDIPMEDDE